MARELGRAGTEVATVKIWDHIERNPGCTVDDLVKMASEDMSIPVGARRMYAKKLTLHDRRYSERAHRSARSERHPCDVDADKAIRHVVVTRLNDMRRCGSVRRDEDGRYFTARPIRRTGIGALVAQPEVVREDIARRNLQIAIGIYLDDHPEGRTKLPMALFNAMKIWYETSRSEYLERRARAEAGLAATDSGGGDHKLQQSAEV